MLNFIGSFFRQFWSTALYYVIQAIKQRKNFIYKTTKPFLEKASYDFIKQIQAVAVFAHRLAPPVAIAVREQNWFGSRVCDFFRLSFQ